ncbi:STAS domain-containing protein [Aureimonas pseudogalii]|uniref:ABC-type transporter Mla MlaB component n=1 Tax=Aureimonas pseudogalii TaxID=1744844 RepID=A0A7W6MLB3_9HYPH|nr:STAS domain-containing protein [Aureimonas pseudogalii]MBB3999630.1 ABC-type transporter Mla MlaB component [Aureimonas pseudogalii]
MTSPAAHLVLDGSYDLSGLVVLREDLMRAAGETVDGVLHLDMGGVGAADVGFVQLLLSLDVSLAASGRRLTATASEAVRALFERCGAPLPAVS